MRFTPKTEKEIQEDRLLPEGEYPFVISKADDKISKAGNEMIELLIRVFKPDGNFVLVSDYLMEAMMYKMLHASQACGLEHEYNSGTLLAENFVGKEGFLKLGIQKDKEGNYPDKNVVKDYVVEKDKKAPAKKRDALQETLDSDEIPF